MKTFKILLENKNQKQSNGYSRTQKYNIWLRVHLMGLILGWPKSSFGFK